LFGPASNDAYQLPYQIYRSYSELREMMKKRDALNLKTILSTCKGTTLTTEVSYRSYRYTKFYTDLNVLKRYAELKGVVDFKELQDGELRLFLDDIRDLIQLNADPAFLRGYYYTYIGDVYKNFEIQENVAALNWLDGEVAKLNKPVALEDEYNDCMVQAFRTLGDKTKEADFLARTIKIGAKSKYAKAAFERLTDLYLTFWQLPDKAIQVQQERAKVYAGTKDEYDAEMRLGKIYYENKKYAESIFALTKLIAKLPKNEAKEPARTMLGLAYIGAQSYDEARNEFTQVIGIDKGEYREKSLYLMGYSYISEQKYQEAAKPFKSLIQLYPAGAYAAQASAFLDKIKTVK
jgi:tetratricopeptide (TPR) repeat protein